MRKEELHQKYIKEKKKNEAIIAAKQISDQLFETLCKLIGTETIYGEVTHIQAIVTTSRTAHTFNDVMPIQRYIDIDLKAKK